MFADVHIALSDIEVSVQDIINISSTLKADKAVGHEQPNVSSCKKEKKKLQIIDRCKKKCLEQCKNAHVTVLLL